MDFDYSWREPTGAQLAALEHVYCCLGEKGIPEHPLTLHQQVLIESNRRVAAVDADILDYGLSPFDLAEMMLTADDSLWYAQAKAWAEGRTPDKDGRGKAVAQAFQLAGAAIVRIVEWGYQDAKWWDLQAMFPDPSKRAIAVCSIIEANRLVYELTHFSRGTSAWDVVRALAANDTLLISGSFAHLPFLLVPRLDVKKITRLLGTDKGAALALGEILALFNSEFRKQLSARKQQIRARVSATYEPTKCIHPKCGNLVAPPGIEPREGHFRNYRGTGACQKGHNAYFCTRCHEPHSFASKIGQQHYQKYYGKDFDGTDMTGQPWKRW